MPSVELTGEYWTRDSESHPPWTVLCSSLPWHIDHSEYGRSKLLRPDRVLDHYGPLFGSSRRTSGRQMEYRPRISDVRCRGSGCQCRHQSGGEAGFFPRRGTVPLNILPVQLKTKRSWSLVIHRKSGRNCPTLRMMSLFFFSILTLKHAPLVTSSFSRLAYRLACYR